MSCFALLALVATHTCTMPMLTGQHLSDPKSMCSRKRSSWQQHGPQLSLSALAGDAMPFHGKIPTSMQSMCQTELHLFKPAWVDKPFGQLPCNFRLLAAFPTGHQCEDSLCGAGGAVDPPGVSDRACQVADGQHQAPAADRWGLLQPHHMVLPAAGRVASMVSKALKSLMA